MHRQLRRHYRLYVRLLMETMTTILKPDEVAPYLLKAGLLQEEHIVLRGVEIVGVSRRNHNFQITTRGGPCWFLKQGVGPERRSTIAHEAQVYRLLARIGHAFPTSRF